MLRKPDVHAGGSVRGLYRKRNVALLCLWERAESLLSALEPVKRA